MATACRRGLLHAAGAVGESVRTAEKFRIVMELMLSFHPTVGTHQTLDQHQRMQRMIRRLDELRGKSLACWCPLDKPCHVDVLCEIANRGDA